LRAGTAPSQKKALDAGPILQLEVIGILRRQIPYKVAEPGEENVMLMLAD
jgi:hypothetical protein